VFDRLFLPLLLIHAYEDKDYQEAAIMVNGGESPRSMHNPAAVPIHAAR
jgi:hypothetical protein